MKKPILSFNQMLAITGLYPKNIKKKAAYNGDNLIVSMDTGAGQEEIAFSTDCKISIEMSGAKATTKDSAGWEEIIAGNAKWSIDCNGLTDYHPSAGYHGVGDISNAVINKTKVTLYFQNKQSVTGDQIFWGVAYVTKCELSAKQGDTVTYTASFTGTGALTQLTHA